MSNSFSGTQSGDEGCDRDATGSVPVCIIPDRHLEILHQSAIMPFISHDLNILFSAVNRV